MKVLFLAFLLVATMFSTQIFKKNKNKSSKKVDSFKELGIDKVKLWTELWKRKDKVAALNEFKSLYGLPINTIYQNYDSEPEENIKDPIFTYIYEIISGSEVMHGFSFQKNLKYGVVSLIESNPTKENIWKFGRRIPVGIEKNTLFFRVKFFENIFSHANKYYNIDLDVDEINRYYDDSFFINNLKKPFPKSKSHTFIIKVKTDDSYEVLPHNYLYPKFIASEEEPCSIKQAKEEPTMISMCIKEKKSMRKFDLITCYGIDCND